MRNCFKHLFNQYRKVGAYVTELERQIPADFEQSNFREESIVGVINELAISFDEMGETICALEALADCGYFDEVKDIAKEEFNREHINKKVFQNVKGLGKYSNSDKVRLAPIPLHELF